MTARGSLIMVMATAILLSIGAAQSQQSDSAPDTTTERPRGLSRWLPGIATPKPKPLPQGADPGATLITLNLQKASPEAAFTELARLAKIQITPQQDPNTRGWTSLGASRPITASYQNQPFWPTFFDLCAKADVSPNPNPPNYGGRQMRVKAITLNRGSSTILRRPRVDSGSFSIMLNRLTRSVTADLGQESPSTDQVQAFFAVLAEPKIGLKGLDTSQIDNVTTERGESLVMPQTQGMHPGEFSPTAWYHEFSAIFKSPKNQAGRIARLQGSVTVISQTGSEDFVVQDPLNQKSVRKTIDGIEVEFKEGKKLGGQFQTIWVVKIPYGDPASRFRVDMNDRIVRLIDDNGRELQSSSTNWGGGEGYSITISFHGTTLGPKSKAILTMPTGLKQITVPFEFKDVPIP